MHTFFIFGGINSKMSHQIAYGQNENVQSQQPERCKRNPYATLAVIYF